MQGMSRRPHAQPPEFHPERPGLVRPVRADTQGESGPTPRQLRGRQWRRTSQGFYVPSAVDGSRPEQRIVEAGHDLTELCSVTGWGSLRWQGALWFDGTTGPDLLPVDVAVIHGKRRSQPGIAVTSEFIPPRDRRVVDGLRVTIPVCAAAFLMRYAASPRAAGRALSMAAAADLVSIAEMNDYKEWLYHWIGIPQLREGLLLAEENAWSPREYDVAKIWELDARLPRLLLNRPVFDLNGRHLGTPDFIDPTSGAAGQYDSVLHLVGSRRAKDVGRDEDFRGAGLEMFTILNEDLADIERVVARMHATRQRAIARRAVDGPWTLVPPPRWTPTHTVALRRGLTYQQRERYLGYRRTG